ncbi:MAG: hypothetical protein AAF670_15550 [Planctomycetota bacterium]
MDTTTNTIERLAWDGPLSFSSVIAIALISIAVIHWSLRRETHIRSARLFWLFWILRVVALLLSLWMLLAPSRVVTQRTTTSQTLVIATDVSPSMGVVDEPDTADDVRWAVAASDSVSAPALTSADRAVVAARTALEHFQVAARLDQRQAANGKVMKEVTDALDALIRVRIHIEGVDRDSETNVRSGALLTLLDDEVFHRLRTQADSSRGTVTLGLSEQLSDACYNATAIERRSVYLADQVRLEHEPRIRSLNREQVQRLRERSRLQRVAGALRTLDLRPDDGMEQKATIRYCRFDSSASLLADREASESQWRSELPSELLNQVTDIGASLDDIQQLNSSGQLAAVILYSDTNHTVDSNPLSRVPFDQTPVYVVPIGNPKHTRDVSIAAVLAPSVVMRGDDVVIEVDIQTHDCNGESCTIELVSDENTLSHQTIKVTRDASVRRIRFDTRMTELGRHRMAVRIAPLEKEATTVNNIESFDVNVTRSKIGVLLADEVPRWEFRYLAQLFRRDPKIEADELLFQPRIVATGARSDSRSFPDSVDEWAQYDVVILGDVETKRLPPEAQESLIAYLRQRGGSLILLAGSESMPSAFVRQPLEQVLPVKRLEASGASREGYSLRVTESGNRHHALMIAEDSTSTQLAWDFVNRNAPARWLSPFRRPKPTARTLIAAVPRSGALDAEQAFLCWQPVGRGRIIYISGPETYRLRYLHGDKYHFRLWGQLLRWAIASDLSESNRLVKLRSDKNRYDENEEITLTVQLVDRDNRPIEDADLSALATCDDAPPVTVQLQSDVHIPGRYSGQIDGLEPGQYDWRVTGTEDLLGDELTPPVGHFLVRPFVSRELVDTRCDLVLANKLASATGGQVLPPTAVAEVVDLTDLRPIITESTSSTPLWIRWEWMFLVIGCLSTEWIIRKSEGFA